MQISWVLLLATRLSCVSAMLDWHRVNPRLAARGIDPLGFTSINDNPPRSRRDAAPPRFLNERTKKFAVNGTNIPKVNFNIGESYAGLIPLGAANDTNQLYHWFFPSTNPAAAKEILIWVTGGPGCSSIGEMLSENGPFIWQPGMLGPVENPWSWNRLTNVVWVEQPVGTGFSVGNATARNEEDVARQFLGFWKNFVDLYGLQGYKVYITGSSYSGMYCPYIASAMLDANDKTYYNMSGMMVFDGVYSLPPLLEDMVVAPFHDSWERVFNFNDTFKASIRSAAQQCGYTDYLKKYLVFPPTAGVQPAKLPGTFADDSSVPVPGCDLWNAVLIAAMTENPCFSVYEIFHRCPRPYDPLGFSDGTGFTPDGAGSAYFNRPDVKAAINAPTDHDWFFCNGLSPTGKPVFVHDTDTSLNSGPGSQPVLPNVIDKTKNVILGHGSRDFTIIADGTLLTIQNLTFGGKLGFQTRPSTPLIIPELSDDEQARIGLGYISGGGSGNVGIFHSERGLTYFYVEPAGHFLAMDTPEVAFRGLEVLLGRIEGFQSSKPFTVNMGAK